MANPSIKVLIADNSPFARALLRGALSEHPAIEVIDFASSWPETFEKMEQLRPDAVTIDADMLGTEGMDSLGQLRNSSQAGIVVVTPLTKDGAAVALSAMEQGAFDYVVKPRKTGVDGLPRFREILCEKITAAVRVRKNRCFPGRPAAPVPASMLSAVEPGWLTAIGAGSGGMQTLMRVLPAFPVDFGPILVAQHMPAHFGEVFACRLRDLCGMAVREADHGETVTGGVILLAPGGTHMEVARRGDDLIVQLDGGPRVSGHRPSVDLLFKSISRVCGSKAIGVLMTGSGRDGVAGLSCLRETGAWTMSQDRATSAVFGMPAAAIRAAAVDHVVPASEIPGMVASLLRQGRRAASPVA